MPAIRLHLIDEEGKAPTSDLEPKGMAADMAAKMAAFYEKVGFAPPFAGYLVESEGQWIGSGGFKGGPRDGRVEIAYVTFPEFEGRGVATATARALLALIDDQDDAPTAFAQTLPANAASNRILTKLGFAVTDSLEDPEHGAIWEWTSIPGTEALHPDPPSLRTDRLQLDPIVAEDAPFLLRLVNEEGWRRFIGDRGIENEAAAGRYADEIREDYRQQGCGLLRVRCGDRAVGLCGILRRPTLEAPDLGFAFLDAEAGQGFATEAARAVLSDARERQGRSDILAITRPDHAAARRVLAKLGFSEDGEIRRDAETTLLRLRSCAP